MRIFIKTLTGENSTLEVESGNSIEDVKEKFEVIEGFPSYQQHFTFCGWPLEDDRTLADYMIQNDSTLQMSLKLPPEVLVETPNGETVALRCESRDKRDKKWFVFAGVHVEDGRAFEPFDIPKGSTLYLQLRVTMMCEQVPRNNRTKRPRKVCAIRQAKMRIFVKILTGKTWTLEVESDISIGDVKEKIEVMEGTPPYRQRLIFSGRDLEDDKTLVDYNIPNAATLYMILRVGGPPGVLVATPSKKAIALRCESHDIRDEKGLIFTGQHVEDDRVFESFNIPKGCTLHLQLQVKLMCEQLISTSSRSESEQAPQQNLTERPIVADDQKNYGKKLKICALHQAKATEVLEELMSENQAGPTSSEFEDMKREMNTARCKEKEELEAVVSKLVSARCASYETRLADLEAENKKLKLQLSQVAQICRNPESFN